ncbi:MAG TPA: class I SAM-dependent methyltransferase, partial [Solirubrobacteraceae bacterium]|nr:class I SAM-dependent methyltransferase [Solirubrobacteraceae bacterium]
AERTAGPSTELARTIAKVRQLGSSAYYTLRGQRRAINRVLPRRVAHALVGYPRERLVDDDFYIAVGHSKADLDIQAIGGQLRLLRKAGVEVVRLRDMAGLAREQLALGVAPDAESEARKQVRRERSAVLSDERNEAQSRRLQRMIALDRVHVLDLGCGAGTWSAKIATEHPWMHVTGVDAGEEFIETARARYQDDRVQFAVADFLALPFSDGTFDCIYADNSLEHAFDVDATLTEAHRVLAEGGLLVAAIPADALSTGRTTDNHTWKTSAADVRGRLHAAGFVDVGIEEVDTYRLGAAPYPPAGDRMLYVRAWRRPSPVTPLERVDALRSWTHVRLDPSRPSESSDPAEVLHGGYAYCAGMTLVLGEALSREGYDPRWVTMVAHEHPRGRGAHQVDTHEVIELTLADGSVHVLDPMADVRFPYALETLIEEPALADNVERERDAVYVARGYDLYATSFWYRRVVAVAVRSQRRAAQRFVPARWTARANNRAYQALAAGRGRACRTLRRL